MKQFLTRFYLLLDRTNWYERHFGWRIR